jgi:CheY-like chemotaxis protein
MILYVDDDAANRRSIVTLLAKSGYTVMEAGDATEVLSLVEHKVFELIITDVVLPGVNGLDLIDSIRLKWPSIPAIVFSGYLADTAANLIFKGHAEFIHKPFTIEELVAAIERLLPKSD